MSEKAVQVILDGLGSLGDPDSECMGLGSVSFLLVVVD